MCYSVMLQRAVKAFERKFPHLVRTEPIEFDAWRQREPKMFPALEDRLFQNRFAPVLEGNEDGVFLLSPMRYSAFPPAFVENPKTLTTFNARRDNLTSPFWKSAFGVGHGVILLRGFFEWVEVKDLLRAEVVTLPDVVREFDAQRAARRARVEASGKKYVPTKTELADARFRKIVILFSPPHGGDLIVPVIFNRGRVGEQGGVGGFAIVTDDPPAEVRAAGHDRCPVFLTREAAQEWLRPRGRKARELDAILEHREPLTFVHALDRVAWV